MSGTGRRTFLKMMGSGALAAALPASIERALAVPANNRTGSIADVEHIVVLMQENRSLLSILRISPDFRPAYDPLLRMAQALSSVDVRSARTLLTELQRAQPSRPEATQALSELPIALP
jgi:hypothetical protein